MLAGDEVVEIDARMPALISEARMAGAYRAYMRDRPETARGFGKLAEKHRAAAARLCDEIVARVGPAV